MVPPRDVTGGTRGGRPRMGGDRRPRPPAARSAAKKPILFVCIGNACRSQMAEAFARAYGSDILTAHSAGLAPASGVPSLTRQTLSEKNIASEGQFPKDLESFAGKSFDVVVNLSGEPLPSTFGAARMIKSERSRSDRRKRECLPRRRSADRGSGHAPDSRTPRDLRIVEILRFEQPAAESN